MQIELTKGVFDTLIGVCNYHNRNFRGGQEKNFTPEMMVHYNLGRYLYAEKADIEDQIQRNNAIVKVKRALIEEGENVERAKTTVDVLERLRREQLEPRLYAVTDLLEKHYKPTAGDLMEIVKVHSTQYHEGGAASE